jgi:ribose transport system substrate-binding protein
MRQLAMPRVVRIAVAGLAATILIAACGSTSNNSSNTASSSPSSSSASASATASSATALVPTPPEAPLTTDPITQPLKAAPAKNKTLVWLACNLPSCQGDLSLGYKQAAAALGWKFIQINYTATNPGPQVQQALNDNPSYIAITGVPPVAFAAEDAEALKRHIPIVSCFDTTVPDPAKNGVYMQCLNTTGYGDEANQLTAWTTNQSHGKANVAVINVPDYPILNSETASVQAGYKKDCPGCTVSVMDLSLADVSSGQAASKIIAYLQAHPSVNYVQATFADPTDGLPQLLKAAGMASRVKLVGVEADPPALKGIENGSVAAFTNQPMVFIGWENVDALARISEGMPLAPYENTGDDPTWVVDSASQASTLLAQPSQQWAGPAGFQQQFEKLWHVS